MSSFPTTDQLKKYDLVSNSETIPPEDEFIDLYCVWAVEFYTPAHFNKLLEGVQRLGWYQTDGFFRHAEEVADWIYRSRQRPPGYDHLDVGTIYPCGTDVPVAEQQSSLKAQLPSGVEYATAKIYSLTSSLTCVVMGFVFEKGFSASFDEALRTDRKTCYKEPSVKGGTRTICDPQTQKTDHVFQIRSDIAKLSTKWFQENLPGVFSSGTEGEIVPTCEFVTLRRAEPFPESTGNKTGIPKYLSALEMEDFGFLSFLKKRDVWRSKNTEGLKLGIPGRADHNLRYHLILAANESYFEQENVRFSVDLSRKQQILSVEFSTNGLLARWAVLPLLESYHKRISAIRDSAVFRPESRRSPVKTLEALDSHVSDSVDMAAVVNEMVFYAQENSPFSFFSGSSFVPCDNLYSSSDWNLGKKIYFDVRNQATWLQKTDQSLRDYLTGYGSLLGATENVKLQGKLWLLTVVIAVLTLVLALESSFFQHAKDFFVKLWEIITMLAHIR